MFWKLFFKLHSVLKCFEAFYTVTFLSTVVTKRHLDLMKTSTTRFHMSCRIHMLMEGVEKKVAPHFGKSLGLTRHIMPSLWR